MTAAILILSTLATAIGGVGMAATCIPRRRERREQPDITSAEASQ